MEILYDPLNIYRGKYREFIESILKERPLNEHFDHSSCHHVIPICCGGKDNDNENIRVYLKHSEHFIAHRLLSNENPDHRGLAHAFWRMCNGRVTQATPEEYEESRERVRKILSLEASLRVGPKNPMYGVHRYGEDNPHYGHVHTECTRERLSALTKERLSDPRNHPMYGRKGSDNPNYRREVSEETRKNISDSLLGHEVSEETKRKIAESRKGMKVSEETRSKHSERMKGNQYRKGKKSSLPYPVREFNCTCKKCGKEFKARGPMKKYCIECEASQRNESC